MGVLIVAIVFSVPLAAILGSYWVKVKSMEFEASGRDVEARLRSLEAEHRELLQRIEVLETIVTEADPTRLRTHVRVESRVSSLTQESMNSETSTTHRTQRSG